MSEEPFSSHFSEIWKSLRLIDRARLEPLRRRLAALSRNPHAVRNAETDKLIQTFRTRLEQAAKRSLVPYAESLHCEFPKELPVTEKIPEVRAALREHNVVIVCGATGSGKTTQLPKAALLEGFGRAGRIGCTQPRRIAASALADRLAAETQCVCGREIGYQVRFDDHTSDATVIKFMTDGILLAETRADPDLLQYDCLLLDEVHERSLNIDFLLGYVKLLLRRRKDLRILISSATLETKRLSDFFDHAPVIEAGGTAFPVEDCYLPPEEDEELSDSIVRGIEFLNELDPAGDILVFLPGEREIRDANEVLTGRRYPRTEILPLFGRLSASEQARIFQKSSRRRIVLATNVAETSLTIPGIRFVIDSGLVRLSRYNPRSRIQELRVEEVSQASARQRRGRCGRLRDGVCVHLYSGEDAAKADPFTDPEIQRSSLAGVILQMASLRLPKIDVFPFVDPPGPALVREGMTALHDLGALDARDGLTEAGRRLAAFPLDPHLGKILLAGEKYGVLPQTVVIVAFLSIVDPRERPFEKAKEADTAHRKFESDASDFLSILHLWCAVRDETKQSVSALRRFTKMNFLNFRRIREWQNLVSDLLDETESGPLPEFDSFKTPFDPLHKALMSGLPRQLACLDPESREYSDMNGRKFLIFPGSGLARRKSPPQWILSFSVVETSRVFARCVAEVRPGWLEEIAPSLCHKLYDLVEWNETEGFVYARERVAAGKLLIHPGRRRHYGAVDPEKAREIFIRDGLTPGKFYAPGTWAADYLKRLQHFHALEIRMRRSDSLVDTEALQKHFESVLPPAMNSIRDLKKDWMEHRISHAPADADYLLCEPDEIPEEDFPDTIVSNGETVSVSYVCDPGEPADGVTLELTEGQINLVGRYLPEYPPAGYLAWKLDFALRALPKAIRKTIMPLDECAKDFLADFREGKIFQEQPFARALSDFIFETRGEKIPEDLLQNIEYPAYLQVKLAILSDDGQTVRILREIPRGESQKTTLSANLPAAKKYHFTGETAWPEGLILPEDTRISPLHEKLAYPALTDEGKSVGCELFLSRAEADAHHRAGLARLFRLRFPGMAKQLRNQLKPTRTMQLVFFLNYPAWKDDLVDHAVLKAFGVPPEAIRSGDAFEKRIESVRDNTARILIDAFSFLETVAEKYDAAEARLDRFDPDGPVGTDVHAQMDLFFREGFLKTWDAVQEYPRFLKALAVRLERAETSPAKDDVKGAFLQGPLRKFRTALNAGRDMAETPALLEYFLLLEEARIKAFSPEIPVNCKVSETVLSEKWEELSTRMI